jgi:hypothetical protein
MAARSLSQPEAYDTTANFAEQPTPSPKRKSVTKPRPERNTSCVIGDKRKYSIPVGGKGPQSSEDAINKSHPVYRKQPNGDAAFRQAFDFGSLQNLQDEAHHHLPINLRDLERLESNKFIMPRQELSNQTRKRSRWSRNSQVVEGREPTATEMPYSNEQNHLQVVKLTNSSMPPTFHDGDPPGASLHQPPPITDIPRNPEMRDHSIRENEGSMTRPAETIILESGNTGKRHSMPPLVSFAKLIAASTLSGVSTSIIFILEKFTKSSNISRDIVRIRWTCVRSV